MSTHLNSVQERLRYWRERVKALSIRKFRAAVNAELAAERQVSLGTVSNYERPPRAERSAVPRADYVAAVKAAFPEIRLAWLLTGEGEPSAVGQRVLETAGPDGPTGDPASLGGRVLAAHPDLALLSPEASALFLGALTRYAMAEPGMALDEGRILELAADLRWLLLLPPALWGFRHDPDYERFSDYSVAMLHAVMLALPGPGEGDPAVAYDAAPNRRLREALAVGFEPSGPSGAAEEGGEAS